LIAGRAGHSSASQDFDDQATDNSTGREYCCERGDRLNDETLAFIVLVRQADSLELAQLFSAMFKVELAPNPGGGVFRMAPCLVSAAITVPATAHASALRVEC